MGGNAVVTNFNTQETFFAEKIPLQTIQRDNFVKTIRKFIEDLNGLFPMWTNEQIESGIIFNGSTSYIMNPRYDSKEIEAVKPFVGDVDIVVPKELKLDLYNFLRNLEGNQVNDSVKYLGCNKPEFKPSTSQINCVFEVNFNIENIGELKVNVQVDFEFTDFINGEPSEWARFGHSSNLKDAKQGIKAVHHKYLLRSLIGCKYEDPKGIVIIDNVQLSKPARVKIFDVNLGICDQFEVVQVLEDKTIYKQLQRFQYNNVKDLKEVFKVCFDVYPEGDDLDKFWSFVGLCELIKKYTPVELLPRIHQRYLNLLWESSPERTQELERNNPQLDLEVKLKGYEYFTTFFGLSDDHQILIDDYYSTFGLNGKCNLSESFKSFLARKNYVHEDF